MCRNCYNHYRYRLAFPQARGSPGKSPPQWDRPLAEILARPLTLPDGTIRHTLDHLPSRCPKCSGTAALMFDGVMIRCCGVRGGCGGTWVLVG